MTDSKNKSIFYIVLLSILVLFCINWIYNAHYFHYPRVLYSDELEGYFKLVVDDSSLWTKIWGNEVIRPIPRIITLLIYAICKNDYSLTNYILFFNNFIISLIVFFVSYSIQEKKQRYYSLLMSLGAGILYTASRFMQCQIFSILGIMEGLAHGLILLFFFCLIQYVVYKKKNKYLLAVILWVLIVLCHERYISLVIVLIAAQLMSCNSKKKKLIHSIFVIGGTLGYFILRVILLGNNTLRGTAHSNINDTFSIFSFIKSCFKQIAYILGINAGVPLRNGINYRDVPLGINIFIALNIIIISIIILLFVKSIVKSKIFTFENKAIAITLLGGVTIGCCIVSSSISTDIALRFVYVSYSLFLILFTYIISYLVKEKDQVLKLKPLLVSIVIYIACVLCYEGYYRTQIKNVLFYDQEMLAESLYDVTIGNYGKNILQKNIFIIRDSGYLTDNKCKLFFTPYLEGDTLNITLIDSLDEATQLIPIDSPEVVVILEDYTKKIYYDISHLFGT